MGSENVDRAVKGVVELTPVVEQRETGRGRSADFDRPGAKPLTANRTLLRGDSRALGSDDG